MEFEASALFYRNKSLVVSRLSPEGEHFLNLTFCSALTHSLGAKAWDGQADNCLFFALIFITKFNSI